jgi:hypothetical protein
MTRETKLNFKEILQVAKESSHEIKNISESDLAYLRVWASRNCLHVSKVENDVIVSNIKDKSVHQSIIDFIAQGRKFTLENVRVGYIRSCLSYINRDITPKWKATKINENTVLIYPDPATDSSETKAELI